HNLFILKHTQLYQIYQKQPFPLLSRDQYIELVAKQLTYIPSHIVIERLTGDAPASDLFEPTWSIKKVTILNDIDKLMKEKNLYQGMNV
ncbi:MAG: TIGR01212 family radical SAM protein, partial [Floccifex sp.]